ncbi:MAG TPA: hypothetical protein DDZ51_22570 [Planctomycetaceae bacterium]|nr:hypothetical protein [Planctomycetaceae bacterium]
MATEIADGRDFPRSVLFRLLAGFIENLAEHAGELCERQKKRLVFTADSKSTRTEAINEACA